MTFDELFALTSDGRGGWMGPAAPPTDERMVFGGLVVGQALVAASLQARRCHAFHAFFIGMGAKQKLFEIAVHRTRDGGSFDTRRIEVTQGDRLLLAGYSSHHEGNDGPEHEISMPVAPAPESVEDFSIVRSRWSTEQGRPARDYLFEWMLDMRRVELRCEAFSGAETEPAFWFRSRTPITGAERIHQAAIAFASDVGPVYAGLMRHPRAEGELQTASLDHSIWFHRDARADEWLLHVIRSPVARNGRGLSQGSIFNRQGQLVASVAQEFLARDRKAKR
jgi:acyl-CoA thioesterase-2